MPIKILPISKVLPNRFFVPQDGKSCIDGDIVYKDGIYHLFYKTEGHGNGIKVATTKDLTSGKWTEYPDYKQQTKEAVEGAGTFKLIGEDRYILMYDVYMKKGMILQNLWICRISRMSSVL